MSLDKAIQYGKSHRQPYRGAKAIDRTCRNHGSCGICTGNRLYQFNKELQRMKDSMEDWNGKNQKM